MALKAREDEHYIDGDDKWTVHYIVSEATHGDPGDYNEVIQISKNGKMVGHVTWHKDKNGRDKTILHEEGIQRVPASARRVS